MKKQSTQELLEKIKLLEKEVEVLKQVIEIQSKHQCFSFPTPSIIPNPNYQQQQGLIHCKVCGALYHPNTIHTCYYTMSAC